MFRRIALAVVLVLTSACSGWGRVQSVRDIPVGRALRIESGREPRIVSHVTACDGFTVAAPGCTCRQPCTIDIRRSKRLYVHDMIADPGLITTVALVFGFAALGGFLLCQELK